MKIILLFFMAILAGCVSTPDLIVETPTERATLPTRILARSPDFVDHLKGARDNLQKAVDIGVLQPNDSALACVDDVIAKIAPDAPPKSFTPNSGSLLEDASIAYILKRQADAMRLLGPAQPDATCLGLIGQIVYDGAVAARRGLSLINPIRLLR